MLLAKALDIGDVAGVIAAVAALGTLVVYVVIAKYAKGQLDQAERIRIEQSRPYVIAEFVPGFLIHFRVRNIGTTLARSVRISWNEWPESSLRESVWSNREKFTLFRSGVPSLAPHQEIQTLFDSFVARNEKGLPMSYTVTVSYSDSAGRGYEEEFLLDLNVYLGLEQVDVKTVHDVAKELKKIADLMKGWKAFGQGGLKVTVFDGQRKEAGFLQSDRRQRFHLDKNEHGSIKAALMYVRAQVHRRLRQLP